MVDFRNVISRKGAVETLCILYAQDDCMMVGLEKLRHIMMLGGLSDVTSHRRIDELAEAGLISVEQLPETGMKTKVIRLTKYGKVIAKAVLKAEKKFKEDNDLTKIYIDVQKCTMEE